MSSPSFICKYTRRIQSFRIADRPSFHWLMTYLCPKITDSQIPRQTMITDNVTCKTETVDQLDIATIKVGLIDCNKVSGSSHLLNSHLQSISSQISVTYDRWSTWRHRPFSAFTIHYIKVDPQNRTKWTLESQLLEFNHMHGQHTGEAVGKELLRVVDKYDWHDHVRSLSVICYPI